MIRPAGPPDPHGGFPAALKAYRDAFRGTPDTFLVNARDLDRLLAPAMREAIQRGRKLSSQECADALGIGLPPDGALW